MLVTGHRDGQVRWWDARSEVHRHIATVAPPPATQCDLPPAGPVTRVHVCPVAGWLASGHESGEVRLFKWRAEPSRVPTVVVGGAGGQRSVSGSVMGDSAPGWACVLRCLADPSPVTALEVASALGVAVAGHRSGAVVVLDALQHTLLFVTRPGRLPVPALRVGILQMPALPAKPPAAKAPAPPKPAPSSLLEIVSESEVSGIEGLLVVCLEQDCCWLITMTGCS